MIEVETRTVEARTEADILHITANGKLTATDYETVLMPAIDDHIRQVGRARVLLEFGEDFKGWEAAAMIDDMKLGFQHWRDFRRIALVNAPAWMAVFARGLSAICPGECRPFPRDEIDDAWAWVKA